MTYDFAPLFRTAIGFDRLARLVDTAANVPSGAAYPPYNIEKTGDSDYLLTMALAGFASENVDVTLADNTLVIRGSVPERSDRGEMLHRGIATRAFERRFVLADHIEIGEAHLDNGLLTISIKRITPEALKPRHIPISSGVGNNAVLSKQVETAHAA